MNSQIIRGKIWHHRTTPRPHSFTYPACSFAIDLDELENLARFYPLLGINRLGIYSIWEKDYLGAAGGFLKQRVLALGSEALELAPDAKIVLITMPRLFGYVFNPVNFYLILDSSRYVHALISEVHNTFGEAHLYFSKLVSREQNGRSLFNFPKEFYVSPFLKVAGNYRISVGPYTDKFDLSISLDQDSPDCLTARLWGQGSEFSAVQILKTLATRPLVGVLAMCRIHFQGILLFFFRSAHITVKPTCRHRNTFRSEPSWLHKLRLRVLFFAARFRHLEGKK